MLEPSTVDFEGKTFVLGKFPATVGREILLQYPTSALPKLGDYKTNHALMLRIMSYVGVQIEGRDTPLMLTTEDLINNQIAQPETLVKLEWAMIQHNFGFFTDGRASGFLDLLTEKLQVSISGILTGLSGQS